MGVVFGQRHGYNQKNLDSVRKNKMLPENKVMYSPSVEVFYLEFCQK